MEQITNMVMDKGKNILNLEDNLNTLETKLKILSCRASDFKQQVAKAEQTGKKKRKREVENWFEEVELTEAEFNALKNKIQDGGLWGNRDSGDSVAKLVAKAKQLMEQSQTQHFVDLLVDDHDYRVLDGGLLEVGKCLCRPVLPKVKNVISFQKKLDNLKRDLENLVNLKNNVNDRVEEAEKDGYLRKPEVVEWLKEVEDMEKEVNKIQSLLSNSNDDILHKFCPNCSLRSSIGTEVDMILKEIQRLIAAGKFSSGLVVENYQVRRVEHIPGPKMEGQSTAVKNLCQIMELLEKDDVSRIGVWGMGGIGKTTLVKDLNNKLLIDDSSMQSFSIVIWVTVSKKMDIGNIHKQIAGRLSMMIKYGESLEGTAIQLHQRLRQEKKFLLILDDVWETIDLYSLGVPQDLNGSKVILTTRFFDVCRQMRTDADIKVDTLDEEESWLLFAQNAGEVTSLKDIEPLAKAVTKECDGLPLAIIIVGASMRGKTKVELWKDALRAFQRSVPHTKVIEDKIYRLLKWSYDALEATGIELSERKRSKKETSTKTCFLYCSLYPEDFPIQIQDLVQSWLGEGLLDDQLNYEDSFNRGFTIIENLKDACLLEDGLLEGTVKMHDVVRDVAIWIASSFEDECISLVQSGYSLTHISDIEFPNSVKRVSLMYNKIECLPDCAAPCPDASTLLLQGNLSLQSIPEGFLLAFQGLKVLNLSETGIHKLPPSVIQLTDLRALILHQCHTLNELPPLGGLKSLQILDCSQTDIEKLPQGIEKLTNLRQLDLSSTYSLKSIEAGIFSCLSMLEMLDMTNSLYKWGEAIFGSREKQATPSELICLKRLNFIYLHLDILFLSFIPFLWIRRMKKFHFVVGEIDPRYPTSSKHKQRRVTLSSLDVSKVRHTNFSSILEFASLLLLDNCTKIETLSAGLVRFDGLRSLNLVYSTWDVQLPETNGFVFDKLPNLEELTLDWMRYLDSISDLARLLGMRLSKLRVLRVLNCHRLKNLFCFDEFIPTLESLEEVVIGYCTNLEELFVKGSSSESLTADTKIPNLRIVKFNTLPKLQTICGQQQALQQLEQLEAVKCNRFTKLPLNDQSANKIKEIRGESEWWNRLELDDGTKLSLQHCFTFIDN